MAARKSKTSKKDKKEKTYTDADVISIFISGKSEAAHSTRLVLESDKKSKRQVLYYRVNSSAVPVKFAERARVTSVVSGDRKLLVIDPRTGHVEFIRAIISSFQPDSVYYVYKLTPITLAEALEIHRGEQERGTLFDPSASNREQKMDGDTGEAVNSGERSIQDEDSQGGNQ